MLKRTIIVTAALAAIAGPALASDGDHNTRKQRYQAASEHSRCTTGPAAEWLSFDQMASKLKEQGYTVRKLERSHGCYEVKATDTNGVRVEFYVDPTTAKISRREGRS